MRKYILTDQERKIVVKYLEFDEKLEGFTTLLSRCRKMQRAQQDLDLIKQLLKKAGPTAYEP
jgi:hypothetical protein